MSMVIGLLALSDRQRSGGFLATSLGSVVVARDPGTIALADPIFQIEAPLDAGRWSGIVIHHSGAPAGDADAIHRQHQGYGYHGLGYHFVVGNGNGLGDGVIHVGYRWNQQLPGVHTAGPAADQHNQHSIGICLVGNGDRQPFTERQIRHLTVLVRGLQQELGLPGEAVHLHRDLAEGIASSPGKLFPEARLREQLK